MIIVGITMRTGTVTVPARLFLLREVQLPDADTGAGGTAATKRKSLPRDISAGISFGAEVHQNAQITIKNFLQGGRGLSKK